MGIFIDFIKDIVFPLLAIGLSAWFASSAKNDSTRAQEVLNDIKKEIEGSSRRMIESSIGILDSTPQVIEGKLELAKLRAIEETSKTIRENITNPSALPFEHHDRNMVALGAHLQMLLEKRK